MILILLLLLNIHFFYFIIPKHLRGGRDGARKRGQKELGLRTYLKQLAFQEVYDNCRLPAK